MRPTLGDALFDRVSDLKDGIRRGLSCKMTQASGRRERMQMTFRRDTSPLCDPPAPGIPDETIMRRGHPCAPFCLVWGHVDCRAVIEVIGQQKSQMLKYSV